MSDEDTVMTPDDEPDEGEESEEDDELLNEIEACLSAMRDADSCSTADYAKVLAVMYCGRSLSIIAKVLYQRMSP